MTSLRVRGFLPGRPVHKQKLVCQFPKHLVNKEKPRILLPSQMTRYQRFKKGRAVSKNAEDRNFWKKVSAIYFENNKRRGAFIGDWGHWLFLKRCREKGKRGVRR